jgi:hypothetical protein
MATITGATLTTLVRQRANLEASQFVTDAEILSQLCLSYQELYDLIVATDPSYFCKPSSTFTVTSTATAAMSSVASDCYKPVMMEYAAGGAGTGYVDVPMVGFHERNSCSMRSWTLAGSTIYFTPPEQAPGTYRLWYVPQATTFGTSSSATVETQNGWEEFMICDVAAKVLAKEESDPSVALAGKAAAQARIEQMVTRSLQEPPTVVDIYPQNRRWPFA